MNVIAMAVEKIINYEIPKEILEIVFLNPAYQKTKNPSTLPECIITRVIRPRVLVDCNLVAGEYSIVDISGLPIDYVDNYHMMIKIPPNRLQNRKIMSVHSIGYLPYGSYLGNYLNGVGSGTPYGGSDIPNTAAKAYDAMSDIPIVSNSDIDIYGDNTLIIRECLRVSSIYTLRCVLSNDPDMNNIKSRAILYFTELCLLAVQAEIYRWSLIKMDQNYIYAGVELGSVKNYIDTLADANENYKTYLKTQWQEVAIMSDSQQYRKIIRLQIGTNL